MFGLGELRKPVQPCSLWWLDWWLLRVWPPANGNTSVSDLTSCFMGHDCMAHRTWCWKSTVKPASCLADHKKPLLGTRRIMCESQTYAELHVPPLSHTISPEVSTFCKMAPIQFVSLYELHTLFCPPFINLYFLSPFLYCYLPLYIYCYLQ